MFDTEWILIDTETTGFAKPIAVVELAAQRMRGWEPSGPHFRQLLNQNQHIPPEASRVHGYTREILERDGAPPDEVYRDFKEYAGGSPIVAYNLVYDLDRVLLPEWERFGIEPFGEGGFCALKLAQRLLDPVPAGNCKLQTLRQFYRLPERGAHTGLGDVETVVDLMQDVLRPIAKERKLGSYEAIKAYTEQRWYPSRINFGKFKGRNYQDAAHDEDLRGWLEWLSSSTRRNNAAMGQWYLDELDCATSAGQSSNWSEVPPHGTEDAEASSASHDVTLYHDARLDELARLISYARERLAGLEAEYTQEVRQAEFIRSTLFRLLRKVYQERDRLRLVVHYRQQYLDKLVMEGEEEAEDVADEYDSAQSETDANYNEAAAASEAKEELTEEEKTRIKAIWIELVKLYHPDKFMNDPDKHAAYENLVKALNEAKDDGNIQLLEEIAADPEGYVLRQGGASLDFDDDAKLESQQNLYDALQVQIIVLIEQLSTLRETPDYELAALCRKDDTLIHNVADERREALRVESSELQLRADQLASEILELTGDLPTF